MIFILLNKRVLATPIENDIKIALVDIDLNKVNSICVKKKSLEDNLHPFSLSKLQRKESMQCQV